MKSLNVIAKPFALFFVLGFIHTSTRSQDIVNLFNQFRESTDEPFTMITREKNDMLLNDERYHVTVDKKNYYIKIDDQRLSNGDGSELSIFTYFGIKGKSGIIAVSHLFYGGDEGGSDGSNRVSFFGYKNKWTDITSTILPSVTLKDFTDLTIPEKYDKAVFYYLLPTVGTDFIIFPLVHPNFKTYAAKDNDPFAFTIDKTYASYYTKRIYIGFIYQWNSITGAFTEKMKIPNTPQNRLKYKEYIGE